MPDVLEINIWDPRTSEIDCCICGKQDEHQWSVPIVNGDVVSNDFPDEIWHEHGGGQAVCRECYEKHERGEIETFDRYYLHLRRGTFIDGAGI